MPLNAAFVMPACLSWATKRVQDPPRGEQIIERPHRPDLRRSGRGAQIGPRRRDHQVAAVRQHHDQLTLGRPDRVAIVFARPTTSASAADSPHQLGRAHPDRPPDQRAAACLCSFQQIFAGLANRSLRTLISGLILDHGARRTKTYTQIVNLVSPNSTPTSRPRSPNPAHSPNHGTNSTTPSTPTSPTPPSRPEKMTPP